MLPDNLFFITLNHLLSSQAIPSFYVGYIYSCGIAFQSLMIQSTSTDLYILCNFLSHVK